MLTHAEITMRARAATDGLSPLECAALGVTIIEEIRQTDQFALVNQASRFCTEHSQRLCKASMDGQSYLPPTPFLINAITHEIKGQEATRPRQNRARALQARLKKLSDAIEDSFWGDLIGGIAIFVMLFGGLFLGSVLS